MKSKTITRHIVMLSDNEARLIYQALRNLSKQDYPQLDIIGVDKELIEKLKTGFYELIKIRSEGSIK